MKKKGTNKTQSRVSHTWNLSLNKNLQFPQLPDASPDPILITDVKGKIYYVNPAWEKLTGYRFEEVKGKNPKLLSSGKTPRRIYSKLWEILSQGKSYSTDEIRDKRKDGTAYQIYSTFFPIRKRGKNLFYVQFQHDITKDKALQKALKESEEKYRMLMERASDIILLFDKNLRIIDANAKASEILGYTKEELLNMRGIDLIVKEDVRASARALKKNKEGKTVILERAVRRKDGSIIYVESSRKMIGNGIFQSIMRDITERKELERQKSAFIGIASHELKTPVTTLSAYAQILEKRLQKMNDQKDLHFLKNIRIQTDRLTGLIDDLLNVSRIDSKKLELNLREFDLYQLIRKVIVDFQYTTSTHEIQNKCTKHAVVVGDEHRIEQVLINLLTNAIKYSPKANKIVVNLLLDKKKAAVCVQDFGAGIVKKDQARLFERFYRTKDKAKGDISGFGLGLYIAKEIIKKHRGKMWLESKRGKGSSFFFALPLAH